MQSEQKLEHVGGTWMDDVIIRGGAAARSEWLTRSRFLWERNSLPLPQGKAYFYPSSERPRMTVLSWIVQPTNNSFEWSCLSPVLILVRESVINPILQCVLTNIPSSTDNNGNSVIVWIRLRKLAEELAVRSHQSGDVFLLQGFTTDLYAITMCLMWKSIVRCGIYVPPSCERSSIELNWV